MKKILILGVFLVFVVTTAFQVSPPADWTVLSAVLVWLAGIGSVAAVGWIVANFLEKMAWWTNLPSGVKWVVPPVLSILIAFGSQFLLKQEILLAQIQPCFALIVTILLAYWGSQAGHIATKAALKK